MKKWIQDFFGITKLIEEKKKQRELLEQIYREIKRNANLTADHNDHYHVQRNNY